MNPELAPIIFLIPLFHSKEIWKCMLIEPMYMKMKNNEQEIAILYTKIVFILLISLPVANLEISVIPFN